MQIRTHLLNVTGGKIDNSMLWANALAIESSDLIDVNEPENIQKGLKPVKYSISTANENELVKRFALEKFPADFTLEVKTKSKAGSVTLEVTNFKSNLESK